MRRGRSDLRRRWGRPAWTPDDICHLSNVDVADVDEEPFSEEALSDVDIGVRPGAVVDDASSYDRRAIRYVDSGRTLDAVLQMVGVQTEALSPIGHCQKTLANCDLSGTGWTILRSMPATFDAVA